MKGKELELSFHAFLLSDPTFFVELALFFFLTLACRSTKSKLAVRPFGVQEPYLANEKMLSVPFQVRCRLRSIYGSLAGWVASQMKDKLELTELGQLEWNLEGKKDNISGWAEGLFRLSRLTAPHFSRSFFSFVETSG